MTLGPVTCYDCIHFQVKYIVIKIVTGASKGVSDHKVPLPPTP